MPCVQTRIFKSNKSQVIRLAKAVAYPDSVVEVEITAVGRKRIITPVGCSWDVWFDAHGASDDFMVDRRQPADQLREPL